MQVEAGKEYYEGFGTFLGALGAIAAFLGVYAAAVASVGWVIGLALGWVAAGIAASITFAVVKYLWPLALLAALWIWASIA
jgi:hypothetical protein